MSVMGVSGSSVGGRVDPQGRNLQRDRPAGVESSRRRVLGRAGNGAWVAPGLLVEVEGVEVEVDRRDTGRKVGVELFAFADASLAWAETGTPMKTVTVILPASIRHERQECGMTLEELSGAAEVPGGPSHLSKIERGKVVPGIEILGRLTTALRRECLVKNSRRSATR